MSRIVVIGAGAIGGYLAARLYESGRDVVLISRGERLERLDRDGVSLSRDGGLRQVRVPVSAHCPQDAAPDHVIVATKTYQLPDALALLDPYGDAPFNLLTVQNGVEAPDDAQAAQPRAKVFGGRLHGFFEKQGEVIHHTGVTASLVMGPVAPPAQCGESDQNGAWLASCLRDAVDTTLVSDARPALWDKFLMASTVGAVAPAFGLTVGQLHGHREARSLLQDSMEEVAFLAAAFGVLLPADCVTAKLDFIGAFPPDVTSSLQRDLEARRPSEFAHLTGAIPRFAQQARVPTPRTAKVIEMLRERRLVSN